MDPRLLEYYNSELAYMRGMAGEFAAQHPKIAARLGMQGMDVADPFVERLLEGFCFLSARTRIRLDAEFPRFTQRLLEVIYPNYVAPTPSMAVLRLEPNPAEGDLASGFVLPRGTAFRTRIPPRQQTACQFCSGLDVTLWPLEIAAARLTALPTDLPQLPTFPHQRTPHSALRLRLRTINGLPFSAFSGLDELPLHMADEEHLAGQLFELLHNNSLAVLVSDPFKTTGTAANTALSSLREAHVLHYAHGKPHPIRLEGFEPHQSLLPLPWNSFHGHNLVHEYFAHPSRFLFLALRGLAAPFAHLHSSEAEITILLDCPAPPALAQVNAASLALFCTPAINLFPMRADRLDVRADRTEYHILADRTRPMDFEIYSLQEVAAQRTGSSEELVFRPLYETLAGDRGQSRGGPDSGSPNRDNYGRYFSLRRELRLLSDRTRMHSAQAGHIGTEVFLSLVDQHEAPFAGDLSTLSIRALVTNRELPRLLLPAGLKDLTLPESAPVRRATFIRSPTPPRPPHAERQWAWRLIRHLGLNYLTLEDADENRGGAALRDFCALMAPTDMPEVAQRIQSLVGCRCGPVTRRLPGPGPLVYGRGVQCRIIVDETGFSGSSPYVFGLILSRFLSKHASINTFTETELHTLQRGRVARWPVLKGGRPIL